MGTSLNPRERVFISYSHKDSDHLERLHIHLKPYVREGIVDIWDDTKIEPGLNWREEVKQAIISAKIAVLLVSADFLASEFIAKNELPPLLAAAKQEGAIILPVILSPCVFDDTKLAQFQTVNAPSRPLSSMSRGKRDMVWVKVAKLIKKILETQPLDSTSDELAQSANERSLKDNKSEATPQSQANRSEANKDLLAKADSVESAREMTTTQGSKEEANLSQEGESPSEKSSKESKYGIGVIKLILEGQYFAIGEGNTLTSHIYQGPVQQYFSSTNELKKPEAELRLVDLSFVEEPREGESGTELRTLGERVVDGKKVISVQWFKKDPVILKLDFKVRNVGEQVAFIKRAEFEMLDVTYFFECNGNVYHYESVSGEYDLELARLKKGEWAQVDISQAVAPNEVDRFQFTVGVSDVWPNIRFVWYLLKARLIYNETDQILDSEPFLFCYPAVRSTSQFAGVFSPERYKEIRTEFHEGKQTETIVESKPPVSQREKDRQENFLRFERECLTKNIERLRTLAQIKAKRSPSANHTISYVLQSHE